MQRLRRLPREVPGFAGQRIRRRDDDPKAHLQTLSAGRARRGGDHEGRPPALRPGLSGRRELPRLCGPGRRGTVRRGLLADPREEPAPRGVRADLPPSERARVQPAGTRSARGDQPPQAFCRGLGRGPAGGGRRPCPGARRHGRSGQAPRGGRRRRPSRSHLRPGPGPQGLSGHALRGPGPARWHDAPGHSRLSPAGRSPRSRHRRRGGLGFRGQDRRGPRPRFHAPGPPRRGLQGRVPGDRLHQARGPLAEHRRLAHAGDRPGGRASGPRLPAGREARARAATPRQGRRHRRWERGDRRGHERAAPGGEAGRDRLPGTPRGDAGPRVGTPRRDGRRDRVEPRLGAAGDRRPRRQGRRREAPAVRERLRRARPLRPQVRRRLLTNRCRLRGDRHWAAERLLVPLARRPLVGRLQAVHPRRQAHATNQSPLGLCRRRHDRRPGLGGRGDRPWARGGRVNRPLPAKGGPRRGPRETRSDRGGEAAGLVPAPGPRHAAEGAGRRARRL